jgi:hypothetical protein
MRFCNLLSLFFALVFATARPVAVSANVEPCPVSFSLLTHPLPHRERERLVRQELERVQLDRDQCFDALLYGGRLEKVSSAIAELDPKSPRYPADLARLRLQERVAIDRDGVVDELEKLDVRIGELKQRWQVLKENRPFPTDAQLTRAGLPQPQPGQIDELVNTLNDEAAKLNGRFSRGAKAAANKLDSHSRALADEWVQKIDGELPSFPSVIGEARVIGGRERDFIGNEDAFFKGAGLSRDLADPLTGHLVEIESSTGFQKGIVREFRKIDSFETNGHETVLEGQFILDYFDEKGLPASLVVRTEFFDKTGKTLQTKGGDAKSIRFSEQPMFADEQRKFKVLIAARANLLRALQTRIEASMAVRIGERVSQPISSAELLQQILKERRKLHGDNAPVAWISNRWVPSKGTKPSPRREVTVTQSAYPPSPYFLRVVVLTVKEAQSLPVGTRIVDLSTNPPGPAVVGISQLGGMQIKPYTNPDLKIETLSGSPLALWSAGRFSENRLSTIGISPDSFSAPVQEKPVAAYIHQYVEAVRALVRNSK